MNKIIDRTGIYIPQTKGWNWSIRVEGNALLSLDGSILKTDVLNRLVEVKYQIHHTECFGVGFIGQGEFKPNKHHKIYSCWYGMLRRCYSDRFVKKHI
jgi:hypothetical protein